MVAAADFTPGTGEDLQRAPYTTKVLLTDGGVYDNLGIETAWKNYETILVSDGGGKFQALETPGRDWPRHAFRVLNVIDNQVRRLAYTVNETVCPRNKFTEEVEGHLGGLTNQYVRASRIKKAAETILGTEFGADWRVVSDGGLDNVVKSHRIALLALAD